MGSPETSSVYHPVKNARTVSWISALGALSERWTLAAHTTGPVQSCGAIGRPKASAREAMALPSESPPHQPRSSMTMLAARASRSSRKAWRPPSISLAVVGSEVPWAKRARLAMSSGRMGSSIQ